MRKRGKRVPRGLLRDERPELVKQLHPTKNAHIDLDKVTFCSAKTAVWVCTECKDDPPGCPHPKEWEATIKDRTLLGSGCPYCAGKRVCPCKSLAQLAPALAVQWHPTSNGDKQPDQYSLYSNRKVWWQHLCEETQQLHEWQAAIFSRVNTWQKMQLLSCPHCKRSEMHGIISRRSTRVKLR